MRPLSGRRQVARSFCRPGPGGSSKARNWTLLTVVSRIARVWNDRCRDCPFRRVPAGSDQDRDRRRRRRGPAAGGAGGDALGRRHRRVGRQRQVHRQGRRQPGRHPGQGDREGRGDGDGAARRPGLLPADRPADRPRDREPRPRRPGGRRGGERAAADAVEPLRPVPPARHHDPRRCPAGDGDRGAERDARRPDPGAAPRRADQAQPRPQQHLRGAPVPGAGCSRSSRSPVRWRGTWRRSRPAREAS